MTKDDFTTEATLLLLRLGFENDTRGATLMTTVVNVLRSTDEQAHRRGQEEALEFIRAARVLVDPNHHERFLAGAEFAFTEILKNIDARLAELKAGK